MSARRSADRVIAAAFALGLVALTVALSWVLVREVWLPRPETLAFDFRGETITLIAPRALLLAVLLPLLPAASWFSLTGYGATHRALNTLLRTTVLALLILAAARPSISRFESHVCVVFLVDVSASIPDSLLEQARAKVEEALATRRGHLVRLVTFADRPAVVPIAPGQRELAPIARPEDPQLAMATDPSAALRLSVGLCPQDHLRRVVLISDGNENRGDLLAEAAMVSELGVRVYPWELEFELEPEVQVRRLDMPDDVRLSEPFVITAEIFSTHATTARIDLDQSGFLDVRDREIELVAGSTQVELTVEVYEPGVRTFTLRVKPDGADRFSENNEFVRSVTARGRPRVLYVEGEIRSRVYLERALDRGRNEAANFDLEVRGSHGFPETVEEMARFDMILLSDVDARYISRPTMAALERYVRELGGTLMLVGGERSFGPGGYDNTLIEEMAPVTFDMQRQRDQPSLSIVLVIDRSGSMAGLNMEMAKDAAKAVVDMLGAQDAIGVIAFDTLPTTVVRLQSASNRARIRADIGRIGVGGGTEIRQALAEAYVELAGRASRLKHVILLTDGVAPWDGVADVTTAMRNDGITVSTVAIGTDVERSLLEMIAELGGGRFYATNDPNNIPQIFVQETSTVSRTNLVEEPFRAVVAARSQALAGIDWGSSPYLLGYVQTRAKPRAEVLLRTERGDPLLARWRWGLGRVAVFTSDIKNRWAVEWVRHRLYPQFWAQVIRDMMRADADEELAMTAQVQDGRVTVVVDAIDASDRFINGLDSTVRVTTPSGDRHELALPQVAAGRYEASFELSDYGPYTLAATHQLDGVTIATSLGAVTAPYPDEVVSSGPSWAPGRRVAEVTGGSVNPTPTQLWDPLDERVEYRQEQWPRVLMLALLVFLLDVAARRVRIGSGRITPWGAVIGKG